MIIDLEPDILECEVKWALESITTKKASGGDQIPVELIQILKDDAVKVLHSICQQIWKTQQWPQDWKRAEHLFMYLLAIGRSLGKYLFSYSAILIFIFLLLSCMSFSYILGIDPLPGIYMACKYLLPLFELPFYFLDGIL